MGQLNYPVSLTAGTPENVNDLNQNLDAIKAVLNGGLDVDNLSSSSDLIVKAGLNVAGAVRRGKSIVAGAETRDSAVSGTGYGLMTTPDRVQSLVLPTDGLIAVLYQAMWQESVVGAARAAIFIGTNQLKIQSGLTGSLKGPEVAPEGAINQQANMDRPLSSFAGGLVGGSGDAAVAQIADVTTGQVVGYSALNSSTAARFAQNSAPMNATSGIPFGGPCFVFAAAGTYDISVQFKASSGTVTAKNRKLWVWTVGF